LDPEQTQYPDIEPSAGSESVTYKTCSYCGEPKPLTDFVRRTGKRSRGSSRRGACRSCRKLRKEASAVQVMEDDPIPLLAEDQSEALSVVESEELDDLLSAEAEQAAPRKRKRSRRKKKRRTDEAVAAQESEVPLLPKRRIKKPLPTPPPKPEGPSEAVLRLNRQGVVLMRGRTDKGRRWQQDTDLETAVTLVREHAAVVVNKSTVRRVYTNKTFRTYILNRDQYTCHFCGEYGDTIDHLLPRAKGGHTTPMNCVCACTLCNQTKAARSLEEFLHADE
jgi:5-methylcytosine-specific restriction endonuclease McrA